MHAQPICQQKKKQYGKSECNTIECHMADYIELCDFWMDIREYSDIFFCITFQYWIRIILHALFPMQQRLSYATQITTIFRNGSILIKRSSSCYCFLLLCNFIKTSKAGVIQWVAKVNSAYHCLIRQSKIFIMLENWKGEEGESHNHFTCINIFCHKFTDKLN